MGKYKISLLRFLFLWFLFLQLREMYIHFCPADTSSHLLLVLFKMSHNIHYWLFTTSLRSKRFYGVRDQRITVRKMARVKEGGGGSMQAKHRKSRSLLPNPTETLATQAKPLPIAKINIFQQQPRFYSQI